MNELVTLKNNDVFTDSLIIAMGSSNQHHAIQTLIVKYETELKELSTLDKVSFEMRPSDSGQMQKVYLLNEPQATFLITLLRNTKQVVKFKLELTKQFYYMRQVLLQRQTKAWFKTRNQGKLIRRSETYVIKELIDYAKSQGSKNGDKLYIVYSKLAKQMTGIVNRDTATISQINNLSLVENIILHEIKAGMILNKHYKDIYKDCKDRLIHFNEIAYLEAM